MKPIRIAGPSGAFVARDALVLAFFCKRPASELLGSAARAFDLWLARTPPEGKNWALIGEHADSYKPMTPSTMLRARAQLDVRKASAHEIIALEVRGADKINPDHQFSVVAFRHLDGAKPKTSYLEIRMPSETLAAPGPDGVVAFARELASFFPYDSGYASLALTWGVDSQEFDFAEAVRGLVFRYPGFDVPANDAVAFSLNKDLRGAYWLTFVGPDALERLGGVDALRAKLDPRVSLERVGAGVLLRAGEHPEVGDVNRGDDLPLLRHLAKVLEPVTKFGDRMLNNVFLEEADRERWERRYFTQKP